MLLTAYAVAIISVCIVAWILGGGPRKVFDAIVWKIAEWGDAK